MFTSSCTDGHPDPAPIASAAAGRSSHATSPDATTFADCVDDTM